MKREGLTRERILAAALAIVDAEGLGAISMRRVGEALSVEAMSLYNHVESKAAILDGIFEVVLAELPPPKRAGSWQATLRDRAVALRGVLAAHPNALPLFATRPAVTPASITTVEALLEVLRDARFDADDALSAMHVLVAYVVGHTLATRAPRDDAHPTYDRLAEASFPRVRQAARLLADHDPEREFLFGLDAILRGLEPKRRRRKTSR